ncbi:MAG: prepilin peptidase [Candidatus Cloacimonetes bacterium]|nr:prepilin peptidase [Candidatus Cloacimonadota bacterium]
MTAIIIIILAVLGVPWAAFFNVLIWRLPRKESIVFPSSHCGECGKPIPFYLNVPIISYILLKGKCKYCSAKIHWSSSLGGDHHSVNPDGVFLQYGLFNVLFLKYALLALWMIPIFFIDGFHQIIPHKLSIPLIPIGLIFALVPQNDVGIVNSLLAALIIFSFLLLLAYLYRFARKADGLGGGDIWLLTGISTFFGLISLPFLVLLASLLGILYFLILCGTKKRVLPLAPSSLSL